MKKNIGIAGKASERMIGQGDSDLWVPEWWDTQDDCTACGHFGMTFFYAYSENGDKGTEHHGRLECPDCGSSEKSLCYNYQVPEMPGTKTAEEIDASIDGRGPDPEDFEEGF